MFKLTSEWPAVMKRSDSGGSQSQGQVFDEPSSSFCPLRCKVTSAHQREAPYRFHLMLLPTQTHTRTTHLPLCTHTAVSAYTLHLKKKKCKLIHPSHLFGYVLVSLPSVCPGTVGSSSLGDFCDVKWKGRFAFAAVRPSGQQFRCPRRCTAEMKMPPPKGVYALGHR